MYKKLQGTYLLIPFQRISSLKLLQQKSPPLGPLQLNSARIACSRKHTIFSNILKACLLNISCFIFTTPSRHGHNLSILSKERGKNPKLSCECCTCSCSWNNFPLLAFSSLPQFPAKGRQGLSVAASCLPSLLTPPFILTARSSEFH